MPEKMWGAEPFWGLGYDWDPDWVLTDRQKELREQLIDPRERHARDAKRSYDEPATRAATSSSSPSMASCRSDRSRGVRRPRRADVAFAMVGETLARYGCASTAMPTSCTSARWRRSCCADAELVDKKIRLLDKEVRIPMLSTGPRDRLGLRQPWASISGARASNGGRKVFPKSCPGRHPPAASRTSTWCM